VKEGMSQE